MMLTATIFQLVSYFTHTIETGHIRGEVLVIAFSFLQMMVIVEITMNGDENSNEDEDEADEEDVIIHIVSIRMISTMSITATITQETAPLLHITHLNESFIHFGQ